MTRKRVHLWALGGLEQMRSLGSITLSFVLGSVAGCWCSAFLEREGAEALRSWLEGYVSLSQSSGSGGKWLTVFWQMLRLPLLLTLLQFTVLGLLAIPLLMGVRGFLLSFAVTGFVRAYAWRGLLCALLLFAPLELVELTALFLLAISAFVRAEEMGKEGGGSAAKGPGALQLTACWAALSLASVVQVLLSGPVSHALVSLLG